MYTSLIPTEGRSMKVVSKSIFYSDLDACIASKSYSGDLPGSIGLLLWLQRKWALPYRLRTR
jgi:hypothetical protein